MGNTVYGAIRSKNIKKIKRSIKKVMNKNVLKNERIESVKKILKIINLYERRMCNSRAFRPYKRINNIGN